MQWPYAEWNAYNLETHKVCGGHREMLVDQRHPVAVLLQHNTEILGAPPARVGDRIAVDPDTFAACIRVIRRLYGLRSGPRMRRER